MVTDVDEPDWAKEWAICPCGKPCGPEFRYFLCDDCSGRTPETVLLRMGGILGTLLRYQAGAERLRMACQSARNVLLNHARMNPADRTCAHEAEKLKEILDAGNR